MRSTERIGIELPSVPPFFAALVLFALAPAGAFTPQLVRDIHEGSGGSTMRPLGEVGAVAFLALDDQTHGAELWVTDGTEAGTLLVKDIRPGGEGSDIGDAVVLGSLLVFSADDGDAGRELWRSDGTEAGTVMVTDLFPGPVSSDPAQLTVVDGEIYFAGNDGSSGMEPWRTDGTAGGTVLVKDLVPSFGSSHPAEFTQLGTSVLFSAGSSSAGRELWRTDGTAVGTVMVRDIAPGSDSSNPEHLTRLGSEVFFSAFFESIGYELWKSDGTGGGTVPVRDIEPGEGGSYPQELHAVDGALLFFVQIYSAYSYRVELWRSDGTEAGTMFVVPVDPYTYCENVSSAAVGGDLLFFAVETSSRDLELWRSDGTPGGTLLLGSFKIYDNCSYRAWEQEWLTPVGDDLYFSADDGLSGRELWVSDGSPAGTRLVADIYPGARGYVTALGSFGGQLVFQADDGFLGPEPWKSDGSADGTEVVADVVTSSASSYPYHFGSLGGALFFAAADGLTGYELWTSDGTTSGTRLVKERIAGPEPFVIPSFIVKYPTPSFNLEPVGDLLFYETVGELWRTDGTEAGTFEVELPAPRSLPTELTAFDGRLFFEFHDTLWYSDGTAAGTSSLIESDWGLFELTVSGESLYFTACPHPCTGYRVWKTDGTIEGTTPIFDASAARLTAWNGGLLFVASTTTFPYSAQLWISDGTAAGTALVADLPDYVEQIVTNGGLAFLLLRNRQLWTSDGTTSGTMFLRVIGGDTLDLTPAGDFVYFSAVDSVFGRELWRTDGSLAGTQIIADIFTGPDGSDPEELTDLQGTLYFSAESDLEGRELWRTDGTPAGTIGFDLRPGPASSAPAPLLAAGGVLFLGADDGYWGRELWRVTTPPRVSVGDTNVEEGDAPPTVMNFPVRLSNVSNEEVRFSFSTLGLSATADVDFASATGTVVVPFGTLESQIEVTVLPDTEIEEDESLRVLLGSPINSSLETFNAEGVIFNDDYVLGSCGLAEVMALHDRTIYDSRQYRACTGIEATAFSIEPGAEVVFEAGGYIALGGGFAVATGGRFAATIVPSLP